MVSKMLPTSEVARRLEVAHSTVRSWCNKGLFPNAKFEETLAGISYWLIPESDLINFRPPQIGRPTKKQAEVRAGKESE